MTTMTTLKAGMELFALLLLLWLPALLVWFLHELREILELHREQAYRSQYYSRPSEPVRPWRAAQVTVTPRVILTRRAWEKLHAFAQLVETEINGFGFAALADGVIRVHDLFTLRQKADYGFASTDGNTVAEYLDGYVASGGNAKDFRVQWHSHGGMMVHWSHQDEVNIEEYFAMAPWSVSLEVNRAGQMLCRVDLRSPFRAVFEIDPVIEIERTPEDVTEACAAEVRRNFTRGWFGHGASASVPGADGDDALYVSPEALDVDVLLGGERPATREVPHGS